jgi:hypothetical protein
MPKVAAEAMSPNPRTNRRLNLNNDLNLAYRVYLVVEQGRPRALKRLFTWIRRKKIGSGSGPYYTHCFGAMGGSVESAQKTKFFQWFHMEETERIPVAPGERVRFRPSGPKFHELCHLDILADKSGRMIQLELTAQRTFLEGRDGLFAHDLVKSFLFGALPDACRNGLGDFMREINAPGRKGESLGFGVFPGRLPSWKAESGWSRLALANAPLPGGQSLVVGVTENPTTPNAVVIDQTS